MATLGMILYAIGVLISLVGGIWLLIVAFQESILWGIGCMVIPFVALIFVVMNWESAKKPFLVNLAGIPFVIIGVLMMPGGAPA